MGQELDYRATLAVDIERSSGRGNVALLRIREVLSTTLRAALEHSGIAWEDCLRHDLGDGVRVTVPARTRKASLIHPFVDDLADRLRTHNSSAEPRTRIRLRMALHAGDVWLGPDGEVAGQPLELLARLLDASPARTALAEARPDVPLALIVSRHFYDETVCHGYPGIDPASFRKVPVLEKECSAEAWLHVPGWPAPAETAGPEIQLDARAAQMVNNASGNGTIYATQQGTQHIRITGKP